MVIMLIGVLACMVDDVPGLADPAECVSIAPTLTGKECAWFCLPGYLQSSDRLVCKQSTEQSDGQWETPPTCTRKFMWCLADSGDAAEPGFFLPCTSAPLVRVPTDQKRISLNLTRLTAKQAADWAHGGRLRACSVMAYDLGEKKHRVH